MKYEETARRLKEEMDRNGISAQELSDRSGIGKSSISGYINGNHCPTNKTAYRLAKVLGCAPEYLMGFTDRKSFSDGYYLHQQASDLADFLRQHPEHAVLFDAAKKVKPEDIEKVIAMMGIIDR